MCWATAASTKAGESTPGGVYFFCNGHRQVAHSLHLARCSVSVVSSLCRVAAHATRLQGGMHGQPQLLTEQWQVAVSPHWRNTPCHRLDLGGGLHESLFSLSKSVRTTEEGEHGDMQSAAAFITGKPVVMRSRTASLAQPFPCWPSLGYPSSCGGAGSREEPRGLSRLLSGCSTAGHAPPNPVLGVS